MSKISEGGAMKVYAAEAMGKDGFVYSVRYLLEPNELHGLQAAGIVGSANEVVGMQAVADTVIAGFELEQLRSISGFVQ